ncbi:MAG: hypothetical protein NZ699_09460 [Roseiflexus sp.]|nr:hypothetical protein [Roseiflexus sp.]MCS7289342.1 hypothetical protein [Roseiflexus sp.]MDW8146408.1 hypothetical protein [Roseiflexaceae bacterium]MDW8233668.1 hypothetical protein [Roseiflexaceae bacterium]
MTRCADSGVADDNHGIGRCAMNALLNRIDGKSVPERIDVPVRLIFIVPAGAGRRTARHVPTMPRLFLRLLPVKPSDDHLVAR